MKSRSTVLLIIGWLLFSGAAVGLAEAEGWRPLLKAPSAPILYIAGLTYWGIVGTVVGVQWFRSQDGSQ